MTLDYFNSPLGPTARFSLKDAQGRKLRQLTARLPKVDASTIYPSYRLITIDGLPDVVEHRAMEPIFYMTDDPKVLRDLAVPANQRLERP